MPTLLDNPAVEESALTEMAHEHSMESVQLLLATPRAKTSKSVLQALSSNPVLLPSQAQQVKTALEQLPPESAPESGESSEAEQVAAQYVREHADEIAADEGREFQLVGDEEADTEAEISAVPVGSQTPAPAAQIAAAAATKPAMDHERMSPLQ